MNGMEGAYAPRGGQEMYQLQIEDSNGLLLQGSPELWFRFTHYYFSVLSVWYTYPNAILSFLGERYSFAPRRMI